MFFRVPVCSRFWNTKQQNLSVKYQGRITIPCALQIGFSEKVENVQEKYQWRCPASVMLTCDFIKTGLHHGYFFEECSYFFHDLYLFSEPTNNHCFDRAAQGQLSKCNRGNIITTISSLIKSSWLKQNERELINVGDTELNFSAIKFISKQLHSQKQWKSKTSSML